MERELLEVDEIGKHVWRQARQLISPQVQITQSHHALEAFRRQEGELVLVEGEALQLQACEGERVSQSCFDAWSFDGPMLACLRVRDTTHRKRR